MNAPTRTSRGQAIAEAAEDGRLLSSPPSHAPGEPGPPGLHQLPSDKASRPALLYVPRTDSPRRACPLAVMLHGAGGTARDGLALLQQEAETKGWMVLAPQSRGGSWDLILENYGPDVARLDRALAFTFARYSVDPKRIAIGGFSDGASYALSLGINNGRLFSHILAFSPGFMAPTRQRDLPRIYIAHGTGDPLLPIAACSRKLVPTLKRAGYPVRYHEFEGGHCIPDRVRQEAAEWFRT